MKIQKLVASVGVAVVAIGIAASTAIPASAANNIKPYGVQETLNDCCTGAPMIGYTVYGLTPGSAPVPHNGTLYVATVKVEGLGGWATPLIPLFNARAQSGANYRVIVNAPDGPPAAPPGGSTTGKLYFDVVGDIPNSVVYNDGSQDLLVWVDTTGTGMASGAPDVAGEHTAIIGGAPTDGGVTTGGDDVAPAVEAPAPFELTPEEVAEPGFNNGGGRR